MILFVILILLVLFAVLEWYSLNRAPDAIHADVKTDRRILEQGVVFYFVYTVENRSRIPRSCIHVCQYTPGSLAAKDSEPLRFTDERVFDFRIWIGGRQRKEVRIPVTGVRRGRYFVPRFRITTGDFLGLREIEKESENKNYSEVVVCPRALTPPDLARALGGFLGEISVRRFLFEDPVLTIGFREYTGREPMKQISWKQSVKGRGLMVKNPDFTASSRVMLVLDTQTRERAFDADLTERAFSLARGVLEELERRRTPYAFSMNAIPTGSLVDYRWVPEGSGEKHSEAILEGLGRAAYQVICSGEEMLDACLVRGSAGTGIILVTLHAADQVTRNFLGHASAAGVQVLVIAADTAEEEKICS